MTQKEKKRFVIVMAALLLVLFMMLLSGAVFNDQIKALTHQNPMQNSTVKIDWEKLYPYDSAAETVLPANALETGSSSRNDKILDILSKFKNIGKILSQHIYKYSEISQIGYIIRTRLSDPAIGDTYIRLKNGYWVERNETKLDFASAKKDIAPYAALSEYLKRKETSFLFCFAPAKVCKIDNEEPAGVTINTNENIDTYIKALDFYRVNTLDFREKLHRDGLDHYSMFFITDHHWTADAGLWAAGVVAREITDRYGITVKNPCDFGTYERVTFEDAAFGAAGRSVTHVMAQAEDLDILFPAFETNFRLEVPDEGIDATGSFEELFVNYDGIKQETDAGGGVRL